MGIKAALIYQIGYLLTSFESKSPVTIQRLCEILRNNGKEFTSLDKLLYALEKLLRVNTVLPALSPRSFQKQLETYTELMIEQKTKQQEDSNSQKEIEEQKKH